MARSNDSTSQHPTLIIGAIAVAVLLVGGWYFWPRTPAQMGTDDEVFTTVDALFTAVTAHNEQLLQQSEQKILACKAAGKLPDSAAAYLDRVVQTARGGKWQPAAEDLYWFMKGQRRGR